MTTESYENATEFQIFEMGPSERLVPLFTIEVTLDQSLRPLISRMLLIG
jgi:hypothetical protein